MRMSHAGRTAHFGTCSINSFMTVAPKNVYIGDIFLTRAFIRRNLKEKYKIDKTKILKPPTSML